MQLIPVTAKDIVVLVVRVTQGREGALTTGPGVQHIQVLAVLATVDREVELTMGQEALCIEDPVERHTMGQAARHIQALVVHVTQAPGDLAILDQVEPDKAVQ